MPSVIRLPDVKARTGLSRTAIYNRVKAGAFPAPFSLGDRAVGWLDSDVDRWIADRAATTTRAPAPAQAIAAKRKARTAAQAAA